MSEVTGPTIYTIGHSTRNIDQFLHLIRKHGVEILVDIRTAAGSRRNPQFGKEELRNSLDQVGIDYTHMKGLGGLRKVRPDSPNQGWENESFRAYADYMLTDEFKQSLAELLQLARSKRIAIMCAEAVPWRCHRNLVSDAVTVAGGEALHIIGEQEPQKHKLCSFARIEGDNIIYA